MPRAARRSNPTGTRTFAPLLFVLALLASLAPSQADELPPAPKEVFAELHYPFWNSGLYPLKSRYGHIGWVDDETLIVEAHDGPPPRNNGEASTNFVRFRWKLGARPEPTENAAELAQAGFCPRLSQTEVAALPKGVQGGVPLYTAFWIPKVGCQRFNDPAMVGRPYVTDTDRRYYVEFAPLRIGLLFTAEESGRVYLMRSDGSERKQLPIWNSEVTPECTHFDRSMEQFYLWTCLNGGRSRDRPGILEEWKMTGCRMVWRVHPAEAATEEICLPFGEWASDLDIVPTRAGLFATSRKGRNKSYPNDPGAAGLYKFDNGGMRRIIGGFLYQRVVSPNGCRIAFHLNPSEHAGFFTPYPPTTMAIDVCSPS